MTVLGFRSGQGKVNLYRFRMGSEVLVPATLYVVLTTAVHAAGQEGLLARCITQVQTSGQV